jgi:hypothetical protein
MRPEFGFLSQMPRPDLGGGYCQTALALDENMDGCTICKDQPNIAFGLLWIDAVVNKPVSQVIDEFTGSVIPVLQKPYIELVCSKIAALL